MKNRNIKISVLLLTAACVIVCALHMTSCMPSYPKEKLPEMIKEIFRIEYKMDVDVAIEGGTLGIYHPMEGLLDVNMSISTEAWDQISNLILVASRVVLSTDADIKFYCVIAQDVRLPELQVVIIKYVDDVKHGMYRSIGRDESFKRTLFNINLTPQAKKERSVESIFDKLGLEEDVRESVLKEFFRSPPTKISDIGFWRGTFFLKEIMLPEFLAEQISNRIKLDFREEQTLGSTFSFQSSEGYFEKDVTNENFFDIRFKIFDKVIPIKSIEAREEKIEKILTIVNAVVDGYKFFEFDHVEIQDQIVDAKLVVSKENIINFNSKSTSLKDVVETSKPYFG
ncbi:MAG: hypothetical protein HQL29_06070 [Candidatus Omnitrophica bacterium]|nr:hypothetical protein [Candidatus Omnitrophota bacterium]